MWPDTADAILLFTTMCTQWRVGFAGPAGLDYAALPAVMDMRRIPRARRGDLLDDIRVLEIETLNLYARDQAQ